MNHYEPEKMSTEQLLIARRICARDLAALDAEIQQRLVRTEDNRQAEAAAKELIAGRSRDTDEAIMRAHEQGPARPWAVIQVPPATEYSIRGQRYSQALPRRSINGY